MTAPKPWEVLFPFFQVLYCVAPLAVGDPIFDPEYSLGTTAVLTTLDADIETLTIDMTAVEITAVKATFESAISILTLVMVRIPTLPCFLQHPLTSDTTRTR